MSIKYRLIIMNFLQFFIWGSWLISLGAYMGGKLDFTGIQIASIFGTMGIASVFMPGILGIVADRWINAERLLGICHLLGAGLLFAASRFTTYEMIYPIMLLNMMVYMPTLALANTVSYNSMDVYKMDIVKDFPPIRVWGTVGFIVAMWVVDLCGWGRTESQLYVGALAALCLGVYAFTLPKCPPSRNPGKRSLVSALGLDAFVLFKERKMLIFFIFAMLLGAALQITNIFGGMFLDNFADTYSDAFAVQHPNILLSVSQMSETLFILAIPFFLRRFGIKTVMLISMLAWVLRFALFGIGNPGNGFIFLLLSMIVYGMAFDFFNVSGSMFVEKETNHSIRASAQGLFMIMTNGLGAIIGSYSSGWVVDYFTAADGTRDWPAIWFVFAAYALVIAVVFAIVFKYKHDPEKIGTVSHG
ncbi:MAG: nucleoside permease [Bacteroides sp.]|nr:nucleoside permease [Bacteroides sp.]